MPAVDREWSERIEGRDAHVPAPTPAPKPKPEPKPVEKKGK